MTTVDGPRPTGDEASFRARFRERAVALWGEDRAAATGGTLERAAHAVWVLGRLDLAPGDFPGFYLDEAPGGGRR